jgi:hypothetical protein
VLTENLRKRELQGNCLWADARIVVSNNAVNMMFTAR